MRPATIVERWIGNRFLPQVEVGSTLWFFRRDRIALISLAFIVVLTLAAVLAPYLTPYAAEGLGDPNLENKFLAPSLGHPFGTDSLGRDVFARILFGARTSLTCGIMV
ncbi:MAG: hypothetical protein IIC78_15315, partial [Chloroflexi bacterium]|nr:hypothetical protein [Chloroflexota bacterium]